MKAVTQDARHGFQFGTLLAGGGWIRSLPWLIGFGFVLILGANSGGYWPTAWGWASLAAFWIAAVALVARKDVRSSRLESVFTLGLLAFACWSLLSALWASSATQPVRSSELILVYVGVAGMAILVVRQSSYHALLAGTWAATVLICGYGLLTRVLPERLESIDDLAGNRLAQPLGYWNAMGILAAVGLLLSFALCGDAQITVVRVAAAASTVVFLPTLYFTFSRGAWIALALGLTAAIALEPRRLRLLALLLALGPWPLIGVLVGWRSGALTHQHPALASASHAGHRYGLVLIVLAVAAAAAAFLYVAVERHGQVPRTARLSFLCALVLVCIGGVVGITVRFGAPWTIARHGYDSVVSNPTPTPADLNQRLFTLAGQGRIPQWKVAWEEVVMNPWLGGGAGSYERYWNQFRPADGKVRNVHNLYLETLAETGPIGLGILIAALAMPLVAAVRARRRPFAALAAGAYVAFLAHAAVDWDWQIPAVVVTALFCGAALLACGRAELGSSRLPNAVRVGALALALALGGAAFVGLEGNRAIASSESAASHLEWSRSASDARRAADWAPWSSRPWQLLGEAQYQQHEVVAARASYLTALAKDKHDWTIWVDLATVTRGTERRRALTEAVRLDPRGSSVQSYVALLDSGLERQGTR